MPEYMNELRKTDIPVEDHKEKENIINLDGITVFYTDLEDFKVIKGVIKKYGIMKYYDKDYMYEFTTDPNDPSYKETGWNTMLVSLNLCFFTLDEAYGMLRDYSECKKYLTKCISRCNYTLYCGAKNIKNNDKHIMKKFHNLSTSDIISRLRHYDYPIKFVYHTKLLKSLLENIKR